MDSPANGITFCTGSLGADPTNDLPTMIREIGHRINFVHFRNVKDLGEHRFEETAHPSVAGSLDMAELMQALVDVGYEFVLIMGGQFGMKKRCLVMVYMIEQWG